MRNRTEYFITYLVVVDPDGLVSHTLKEIKDVTDYNEPEDEEDGNEKE